MSKVIYFIDENDQDRNANLDALRRIFGDTGVLISAPVPFASLDEYSSVLTKSETAAFFIDQNMRTGGLTYNGIDLAKYLRGIDARIPIYIVTGGARAHADIGSDEFNVEAIVSKDDLDDHRSDVARNFKARVLRAVDVHAVVLAEREARFHQLLVKSIDSELSVEEAAEFDLLQGDRLAPIQAAELRSIAALEDAVRRAEQHLGKAGE